MTYNFFINDTEINEPIGWDAVTFALERSQNYTALENLYADMSLTFDGPAGSLLKGLFEANGFDATATFKIKSSCKGKLIDQITGVFNFASYKEINNEVSLIFEESGFHRKFKNRLDIPINLEDTKNIDGLTITPGQVFDFGLHSKAIVQVGKLELNPALTEVRDTGVRLRNYFFFPLGQITTDETTGLIEIYTQTLVTKVEDVAYPQPIFTAPFTGKFRFKIKLKGYASESAGGATRSFNFRIILAHGGDANFPNSKLIDLQEPIVEIGRFVDILDYYYDIDTTIEINLNQGDKVALYVVFLMKLQQGDDPDEIYVRFDEYTFDVYTESLYPASTCKAIRIFDAFSQIVKSIAGGAGFRSNFFGGVDHGYQDDGCGTYTVITNGKNIRNLLQADQTKFPIVTSFNDLYNSCSAIWNLGLRVETEGYTQYLRIEPMEYWYNSNKGITLSNVSNIQTTIATDKLYNALEIGYAKWNLNFGRTNGIDEFNTKHSYSLPVINTKNTLTKISKAIASGYAIEITRRIQYKEGPTEDFETDDDIFIIATNREERLSPKHGTELYKAGTISEINEHFSDVTNLLSPETAYNLRFSPARMAIRWWPFISASLSTKTDKRLKFQAGEGNVLEGDILLGDCNEAIGKVVQNMDITQDNCIGSPIFEPYYLNFEYPLTFAEFFLLKRNILNGIFVSCSEVNHKLGSIESVKFTPQDEMAQIKLLIAIPTAGAFSDGFSEGFQI